MTTDPSAWIKASRSGTNDQCVEQRRHNDNVQVRDTKNRDTGPTLTLSPSAYAAWLLAAKLGELDHLIDQTI